MAGLHILLSGQHSMVRIQRYSIVLKWIYYAKLFYQKPRFLCQDLWENPFRKTWPHILMTSSQYANLRYFSKSSNSDIVMVGKYLASFGFDSWWLIGAPYCSRGSKSGNLNLLNREYHIVVTSSKCVVTFFWKDFLKGPDIRKWAPGKRI